MREEGNHSLQNLYAGARGNFHAVWEIAYGMKGVLKYPTIP